MAVTDLFVGEVAAELLKQLISICKRSCSCKSSAEQLKNYIQELRPIIQEIKYSGVELPQIRQTQLDQLTVTLQEGSELCRKVLASKRWQVYKNLMLAKKMEKLEKSVARFLNGPMQAHMLADVHHLRFYSAEKFDQLQGSVRRIEERLGSMKLGLTDNWFQETMKRVEEEERDGSNMVNLGYGMVLGKKKVKEMIIEREDLGVVGIHGIGGSGKTTLAKAFCNDNQVRSYFSNRIIFLTVSQSPNVEQLRLELWKQITGNHFIGSNDPLPQWTSQFDWKINNRILVVLDDVWSLSVLEPLVFKIPGCKTLVVSRFKFPTVIQKTYEVELLGENDAKSLFCHFAFRENTFRLTANEKLVQQVVKECKGLPLALKVIGASLRDKPPMFWTGAINRLSRGEPICESHEINLLERMAVSISTAYLPEKVRECFLDLGSFPEDKKIPLDVLINLWVQIHDIDEEEAFAIVSELSDKNLLTLVKDARAGDVYSSYCEISVTQHDVLRDLALHLSNRESLIKRKRLLMPRREDGLPKEWERNMDQQFEAQIVSIHTGEMRELDWFDMDFPKAEVLILNFTSSDYFLPPFIHRMPKLRALVLINYGTQTATVHNLSVFSSLKNLRSLWLEKITIAHLSKMTHPLQNLRKISLILCRVNKSFNESDLLFLFPRVSELTMDHCVNLTELPSSICRLYSLKSLSITNCHGLLTLPEELGHLKSLQILRIYACPALKKLPIGICDLESLRYLDIAQCVGLRSLPEGIGRLGELEKIDMRECPQIRSLARSATSLWSLRRVICDEEAVWLWKEVEKVVSSLQVQVAQENFDLEWLGE